jgi:hypothetical protein
MSDDFLDDMKRNWREQDAEVEVVASRLKRGLMVSKVMLWLENGVGVFGVLFGAWAVWHGITQNMGIATIAGASVVLTAPLFAWLAWRARRQDPVWSDETPEGVLRQMIARSHVVERLMRICRWQGWALIGLAGVLWAATPSGYVESDARLVFITSFFVASAVVCFGWAIWREHGARAERLRCKALLAEFK